MHELALIQVGATWALVGLIWFVQVVHYPLFAAVGEPFAPYVDAHSRRTSFVVGPLMLVEAGCAVVLAAVEPGALTIAGLALVGVLWAATALLAVPCHRRLGRGFDAATHRRLVATNWVRTAAWSARGGVALAMVA